MPRGSTMHMNVIGSRAPDRRLLRSVGVETGNLYTGFLALAARLLAPGGELVAITPRSFCSGPYFRPFRELFLELVALRRIHVFEDRGRAFAGDEVLQESVAGQYSAGAIAGVAVPGYKEELGRASRTETFVALRAHIDNWRWSGVPFYLRTGKRLPSRSTEIYIQFRKVPYSIFGGHAAADMQPNGLLIKLQPDERIELDLMAKTPGLPLPERALRPALWVSEVVYVPLETELLKAAKRAGCRTMDGGHMNVGQAARGFKLFTGLDADEARMEAHFRRLTA